MDPSFRIRVFRARWGGKVPERDSLVSTWETAAIGIFVRVPRMARVPWHVL